MRPWVAAISGIGGLLVGLITGLFGAFLLTRRRRLGPPLRRPDAFHRKSSSLSITTPVLHHPQERYSDMPSPPIGDSNAQYVPNYFFLFKLFIVFDSMQSSSYHIEPFILPSDQELGVRSAPTASTSPATTLFDSSRHTHDASLSVLDDRSRSPSDSAVSPSISAGPSSFPFVPPRRPVTPESRTASQVYVVHHDGGRPPATVFASDGTEIVELPPRYIESSSDTARPNSDAASRADSSTPPIQLQERRQVGTMPAKAPRRQAS